MDLCHLSTVSEFSALSQENKDDYLKQCVSLIDFESIKKVAFLIRAGANVNKTCTWGYTPLMSAAHAGAIVNMALLIQGGAKIDNVTVDYCTALSTAINASANETASFLCNLMTEDQLKRELHFNNLRYCAFFQYKPDIRPFMDDFRKEKKNRFNAVDVLLLGRNLNKKNPFLMLPKELTYFIYFMYRAVEKKMFFQSFCPEFQESDIYPTETGSTPLIFSSLKPKNKYPIGIQHMSPEETVVLENLSLLSLKEKKSRRKGCTIF